MKRISLLLTSTLVLACGSPKTSNDTDSSQIKDSVSKSPQPESSIVEVPIDLQKLKEKIAANKEKLSNITGDFKDFKTYTQSLGKFDLFTISATADYIKTFLPKAK